MKTIGLLGGMSWESTLQYYRALNQGVQQALGGLHSARIVMHSVDFAPLEQMMQKGDWQAIAAILGDAALGLERTGADFLLLCTNTMHKLAPELENRIGIPLLHIVDVTARALAAEGVRSAGLLGTCFTMEQEFYRRRFEDMHGIDIVIPQEADRAIVNRVIFEELCCGRIRSASRSEYIRIIEELAARGAEAIILGCTEIALLVEQKDVAVQLYDTTSIHAAAAVQMALRQ